MAAPVDAARIASTSGGTAQNEPITPSLPTGITAGDLLVVYLVPSNVQIIGWPTGWAELFRDIAPTNHDNIWAAAYYKIADGSEGATVSLDLSGTGSSARWSACAWRITGADTGAGTFIEVNADSNQVSGTAPDPLAITPAGGAKDYLILWCGLAGGTPTMPPSGNPTNYSNPLGVGSGGGGAAGTKMNAFAASRQLSAASTENPPSWTISASGLISARAIAIYPAAAGQYTDAATTLVALQASGTELAETVDSSTIPMALAVSAVELHEIPDATTVLVDLQASGTEFPAKEYADSATALVDLQSSGIELREVTDTATAQVFLQTSAVEAHEITDAATVLVDLQSSGTDTYTPAQAFGPFRTEPMIVGGIVYQDRSRW